MENLVLSNTADPMVALIYTIMAVCIILLARKIEVAALPGGMIGICIILLLIHSTTLEGRIEERVVIQTYFCIAFDLMLLLLNFIAFLWIDNITSKKRNLKSYDDGLSWFWDKNYKLGR